MREQSLKIATVRDQKVGIKKVGTQNVVSNAAAAGRLTFSCNWCGLSAKDRGQGGVLHYGTEHEYIHVRSPEGTRPACTLYV